MSDGYGKIFGELEKVDLIIETIDSQTKVDSEQQFLMKNGEVQNQ